MFVRCGINYGVFLGDNSHVCPCIFSVHVQGSFSSHTIWIQLRHNSGIRNTISKTPFRESMDESIADTLRMDIRCHGKLYKCDIYTFFPGSCHSVYTCHFGISSSYWCRLTNFGIFIVQISLSAKRMSLCILCLCWNAHGFLPYWQQWLVLASASTNQQTCILTN